MIWPFREIILNSIQQVKKPKSATKAKVNEQLTLPGLENVTKKQEQEDVISILKKNNVFLHYDNVVSVVSSEENIT